MIAEFSNDKCDSFLFSPSLFVIRSYFVKSDEEKWLKMNKIIEFSQDTRVWSKWDYRISLNTPLKIAWTIFANWNPTETDEYRSYDQKASEVIENAIEPPTKEPLRFRIAKSNLQGNYGKWNWKYPF